MAIAIQKYLTFLIRRKLDIFRAVFLCQIAQITFNGWANNLQFRLESSQNQWKNIWEKYTDVGVSGFVWSTLYNKAFKLRDYVHCSPLWSLIVVLYLSF